MEKTVLYNNKAGTNALRKAWLPRVTFAALLVMVTVFVYLPSLDKFFVSDHMSYFLELNGETSLTSGFRHLDYGVKRHYNKGDEVLYRPLLFVVLAFENFLFKRDFRLWNIANLAFHILVAYLLFEMLWSFKRSIFAQGFALLFALLMSNFELVTWNHLGGYILGYGFLLISLWSAREMTAEKGFPDFRWLWIYGVTMTCAMLFHEISVIASLAVIAYVAYSRRNKYNDKRNRVILAAGAPVIIYVFLYFIHVVQCNRFLYLDKNFFAVSFFQQLSAIPLLLLHWLQHILLPVPEQLVFGLMHRSSWSPLSAAMILEIIFPGLIWIGILFFLRQGFERKHLKEYLPFAAVIFFLIVSYAGMYVTGRFSYVIMNIPYLDYFPAIFGIVLLYSLIDFSKVRQTRKLAALTCLLLLTITNGWHVRNISNKIGEIYGPVVRGLEGIEQNIRPKLSIPNFSFNINGIPEGLPLTDYVWRGYPDRGNYVKRHSLHCLYGKYFNSKTPTYILIIRDFRTGKMDLLPVKSEH